MVPPVNEGDLDSALFRKLAGAGEAAESCADNDDVLR